MVKETVHVVQLPIGRTRGRVWSRLRRCRCVAPMPRTSAPSVYSIRETTRAWTPSPSPPTRRLTGEYGEPVFHARLGQVPDHEGRIDEGDCHPHPGRPGARFRAVRLLRLGVRADVSSAWKGKRSSVRSAGTPNWSGFGVDCGAANAGRGMDCSTYIWEGFGEFKYGDG